VTTGERTPVMRPFVLTLYNNRLAAAQLDEWA
jgi:hypothetical protein